MQKTNKQTNKQTKKKNTKQTKIMKQENNSRNQQQKGFLTLSFHASVACDADRSIHDALWICTYGR
jgi:hypothetical protein